MAQGSRAEEKNPEAPKHGALSLMSFVERNWHAIFVAYGVWSVLTQKKSAGDAAEPSRWTKLKQVLGVCSIGFLSFQLEKGFTKYVIKPLMDKYLLSNEEKEQRLRELEASLRGQVQDRNEAE